jgi:hypothetical protein
MSTRTARQNILPDIGRMTALLWHVGPLLKKASAISGADNRACGA